MRLSWVIEKQHLISFFVRMGRSHSVFENFEIVESMIFNKSCFRFLTLFVNMSMLIVMLRKIPEGIT